MFVVRISGVTVESLDMQYLLASQTSFDPATSQEVADKKINLEDKYIPTRNTLRLMGLQKAIMGGS